ncbi:hypothetical protein RND81_05G027400 [Saponaria officinalis]|uniref:Retrovirus-related Pol polyprotein from transposon TNT 1-94-like beta-barrel domain-containing protein n=1 Tax=Saponaria officinalis TaxID=3572 RepID=A0AAW1KWV1_SAPOF
MQDDIVAWWIDSGATNHVCKDRLWFKDYELVKDGSVLYMGNESTAPIIGRGTVVLEFSSENIIKLCNVLHVFGIRKNLVSGSCLCKLGYKQVYESRYAAHSKAYRFYVIEPNDSVAVHTSHYIENVLKKFNHGNCSPVSTPMDPSVKLMPNKGEAISQLEYSQVIGCLMYAMTSTRPDIAFAVGKLSRYTSNPSLEHWVAVKRVLRYLKQTMDYGLNYVGFPSVLEGYSDASWITNMEDHSSTSGWVFLLGGGAIS